MPKKTAKKAPRKPPAKPARPSGGRKPGAPARAGKVGRKPGTRSAVRPRQSAVRPAGSTVSSGRGPSPADLGRTLVDLFNQNRADDWIKGVWSRDVESIEGTGQVARGREQILAKWDWWTSNHEVLGASAEGPYVGATGFAVKFHLHVKDKAAGADMNMTEIAVYSVRDGRIVREEFMYA